MGLLFNDDVNELTFKDCISCIINYLIFTYVRDSFLTLDSNKYLRGKTDSRIQEHYGGEEILLTALPQRVQNDKSENKLMRYHFVMFKGTYRKVCRFIMFDIVYYFIEKKTYV